MQKRDREQILRNVNRGATKLDEIMPDWYEKINQTMIGGYFNMRLWDSCVVGSLELVRRSDPTPSNPYRMAIVLNGTEIVGDREIARYGFMLPERQSLRSPEGWEFLEDCWVAEIQNRLHAKALTS